MEEKLRSANQVQDGKVPDKRKSEQERIGGGGGGGGGSGKKPWRTEDGKRAGKLGKYEKHGEKQRSANQIQDGIVKEKVDKNDEELEKEVVEEEVGQEGDTVYEEGK